MANFTVSTDIDAFMQSADNAAARGNLSAAKSGTNIDITSVALTSGTISGTPSGDTAIVNKAYADSISSGINFHDACLYATTAALPAYTYDNGPSNNGVGASITATVNGPFSPDGVAIAVTVPAQRILVKNETSTNAPYNGVYTVERAGGASETFKLVRATDYDTSGSGTNEIQAGDFILISGGSTLLNTAWIQQTQLPISVGVDNLSFVQFSAPISGVVSVNQGGTGQQTYTDGQLLIGNSTGNTLSKANLTAGTGMTVTNAAGAITLSAKGFGSRVKIVGIDALTIQGCINLCTDADGDHPYTVLIPPSAGAYVESLTLKGSVSLVGLTTPLNSDAVQISGVHTYTPDNAISANSNRIGFQNLVFISAAATSDTLAVLAGAGGIKYASQLRFSGCVFSGGKNSGISHLKTCDNVSLYLDNCRFESSTGNAASNGLLQGNGPLYLSNNILFDVFGRAIDIPVSTTLTKTATSTTGSHTLTVSDTTGLSVGQKITGTGLYSTTTITAIGSGTVTMSSPPQTSTAGFTATFGQTPYVEIHDSVIISKGAEAIRLGNGLLTCNLSNITNTASGGSGINMLTANTVIGIVNSSFTISDVSAYTITAAAATCYAALNGISYSSSILSAYSTLIGANVTALDYTARATSIENGGTGATTQQAALNALAGAVTNNRVLAGNGTNVTLRALVAADIPSLDTSKLTTGTLGTARGGTGTTSGITAITTTQLSCLTTAATANLVPQLTTSGLLSLTQMPTIPIANGGTGATIAATARLNLGVQLKTSCKYATVAALPANTASLNGQSEWILTANGNAVLSVDGVVVSAGDRILVKDEATQANNGIYNVTQVGSVSLPFILTRSVDYNQSTEINVDDIIPVLLGTQLANTVWTQKSTVGTVGSSSITFSALCATNLSLATAPATNASTGVKGQIAFDSTGIYVCTATNTWRKAALATF